VKSFGQFIEAPAGSRLILNRLLNRFGKTVSHVARPTATCMNCGSSEAIYFYTKCFVDFNVKVLPKFLRRKFIERCLGICKNCGICQDYNRFSRDEMFGYLEILNSKDMTTSEEAFTSYPVPKEFVENFNDKFVFQRFKKHKEFLDEIGVRPERVLFLRPTFGGLPLAYEKYGSKVSVIDISKVATEHIKNNYPNFDILSGNIHGYFTGEFLGESKYDLVVCFHVLVHCIDVHDSISKIASLLKPGGIAIFAQEINVKPWNPFHVFYPDENDLNKILLKHFVRVERIDNCDTETGPHVTSYTSKGDNPDFIAFLN
jgi:SAM-dependent methyltransferase